MTHCDAFWRWKCGCPVSNSVTTGTEQRAWENWALYKQQAAQPHALTAQSYNSNIIRPVTATCAFYSLVSRLLLFSQLVPRDLTEISTMSMSFYWLWQTTETNCIRAEESHLLSAAGRELLRQESLINTQKITHTNQYAHLHVHLSLYKSDFLKASEWSKK